MLWQGVEAMKEHPIIFSAPMVRAILAGNKRQTRRIIKPQPEHLQRHKWKGSVVYEGEHRMWCWKDLVLENIWDFPDNTDRMELAARCSYGITGDQLWVREAFYIASARLRDFGIGYRADHPTGSLADGDGGYNFRPFSDDPDKAGCDWSWADKHIGTERWIPPIHMPRWASRITLELTDVRVERLNDISEADARAEGCRSADLVTGRQCLNPELGSYRLHFQDLWDSIHGTGSWDLNPWVWCLSFKEDN